MKRVFKTMLFASTLLFTVNATAQDSPLQFGVKAGLNLSNFGGDVENNKTKVGFNAGITLDYGLTPDWYLMTELEFSLKGSKWEQIEGMDIKTNISYLQLPVHIGYKLTVAEDTKLVFHAGPYLAYGLSGKEKFSKNGQSYEIDLFKKYDGIDEAVCKRFDFGVGLGAGVEFGKIGVGLGYDFGLTNISNENSENIKNQNAYLTVGYKF